MKPVYLRMTAFASYSGTAEVDFTKLYEDGIFLITGKTGGGKTTILDAICASLYGAISLANCNHGRPGSRNAK